MTLRLMQDMAIATVRVVSGPITATTATASSIVEGAEVVVGDALWRQCHLTQWMRVEYV